MGFAGESATGVPRPQRPISPLISADVERKLCAPGRRLRGFSTTAALTCAALVWFGQPRLARAESNAEPGASAAAPAPASEGWSRRLARSHYERALELEARGDIAQALREYTEAIAIDSTLGDAYAQLGALRERMGDPREAELVYSEAVRLGDGRARALLLRSHLHRAAVRSAQALSDLEASVELDPNADALAELAHHYVEAHAWSAALASYRRIAGGALASGDRVSLESARLEVRALRVLAAETDPSTQRAKKHDWVARALSSIARR